MIKNYIALEDWDKAIRLCMLVMKMVVPKPLTQEERNEYDNLVIEFNSKYPTWKKGYNFITGELMIK